MISGLIDWITGHTAIRQETAVFRKLVSVGTQMLSSDPHAATPLQPIVVQLNADLVQVSSIALGHPRLAVINGKQVAEGDTITLHTPTRSIAITLRVVEIADRRVILTDGTQMVTAHLTLAEQK
jgi:hypothetical protein